MNGWDCFHITGDICYVGIYRQGWGGVGVGCGEQGEGAQPSASLSIKPGQSFDPSPYNTVP